FFSSRRRHTRFSRDWSSDVCSSDLSRRAVARQRVDHGLHERRERVVLEQRLERGDRELRPALEIRLRDVLRAFPRETTRSANAKIGRASCRERGEVAAVVRETSKQK